MSETLLQTKLYIPPLQPNLVKRPHLIDQLNQGLQLGHKLSLISAPAGFGKTTLASEWLADLAANPPAHSQSQNPIPEFPNRFAWITLDEGDSDLAQFLAYIIAAVQRAAGPNQVGTDAAIGDGALDMLQSPQPPVTAVLTTLINDIAAIPGKIILALDDYHVINSLPFDAPISVDASASVAPSTSVDASTDVDGALAFLIEHLPQNLHLVIATRDDPQLPLARLRARGQLSELRALDLRFSSSEAAEFLNQVMDLDLHEEDIAALESRTEGWIAGLQLAAISMQGQKDTAALVKSFTGSHRYVLDYLIEEVLEQQPASVQDFLLQTAVLKRMNGSLCDALRYGESPGTAEGTADGQAVLEMLERANLFIVPLDEKRYWYRYHHLFSDLLRRRLQQQRPDLVPVLEIRASEWYEENGTADEAVAYAMQAGDFERAVRLLDKEAAAVWERGAYTKLRRWVAKLPAELVCARPRLCIIHAEDLLLSGRQEAAEEMLQAAERSLTHGVDQAFSAADSERIQLLGSVAATRAFLAFSRGDVPGIMRYSRQALDDLPEQDSVWRSSAAGAIGDAHIIVGDMAAAQQVHLEAMRASQAAGNIYISLINGTKLAITLRNRGRLEETIESCRQQLQAASDNGLSGSAVAGWLLAVWGETLAELNDLDGALQQTESGAALTALGGHGEDVAMFGWSNLCLIRVYFSRGDLVAAEEIIHRLEVFDRRSDVPPWISSMTAAWQARLWLAQDKLENAVQWAQERGLGNGRYHASLQETTFFSLFDYVVLARLLLAQGRVDEVTDLLARLLETAEAGDQVTRVIEIHILRSLAFQAAGDLDEAMAAFGQALSLAEAQGFMRIFVDEGPPMAGLLQEAAARGVAPDYVPRLLSVFPPAAAPKTVLFDTGSAIRIPHSEFLEPLSDRELEILRLIAAGLSNQEIASRLFLSLNTVKAHTRNIYGKLDVHSRMQAVATARAAGILPSP